MNDYVSIPMDENGIYKCRIGLTPDKDDFNEGNQYRSDYLRKAIAHEIGHVFLLTHPTMEAHSLMHPQKPTDYVSATVTSNDKANIAEKWGN